MKRVVAVPSTPVAKAGAKTLHFNSLAACARFFGSHRESVYKSIRFAKRIPFYGFWLDYDCEDEE